MCVVEKDSWSYPIGDGCELRGDDMPNPYEPVLAAPWGGWELPWDRGRGSAEVADHSRSSEPERLAWWIFVLGMVLWEIQQGHRPPDTVSSCMPEERWLAWALCWVLETEPSEPPRWFRFAARAAWRRRQLAMLHLQSALVGLYWGLEVQARTAARTEIIPAQDAATLWC